MKMKISPDVMMLVGALGVAAFLAAQDSRQEWTLRRSGAANTVQFHINRSHPGRCMSRTWDVPVADFQGLDLNASGLTHFEYVQDAGSLLCQGRFVFGRGSGTFVVQPNPHFAARLAELGYEAPDEEQIWSMILSPVSLDFARGVRDAGLNATTAQLIELRNQGVTVPYIRNVLESGGPGLTLSQVIQLKTQGVSPGFMQELREAGYDLPVSRMIDLKLQGINAPYIHSLQTYGLKPGVRDLIQFKHQGVTPEYLKSLKEAGFNELSRDQVTNLKLQGVSPEFIRTAKDLGFEFTPRELVDLKLQGVTDGYLRHLRATGIRNLTASQIVKLKIHGVD
jgi:hypothetical protein